jgi:phosphinothricin acetyltransferase
MNPAFEIRTASPADGEACARVYAPYVEETAISFESEPPDAVEMGNRIASSLAAHDWLVLEVDGRIVGYAYGAPHRTRDAYRWAADVSVYLEPGRRRTGAGRALYEVLFQRLRDRGYRIAVAGITLPNQASVGLHRAMGFESVGVYRGIGHKLGSWHDVEWLQRPLVPDSEPLREPTASGSARP